MTITGRTVMPSDSENSSIEVENIVIMMIAAGIVIITVLVCMIGFGKI